MPLDVGLYPEDFLSLLSMEAGKSRKKKVSVKAKSIPRKSYHTEDGSQCYYGTDEEEYVYRTVHRYASTNFPLFSNVSDDEVIKKSKSKQFHPAKDVNRASEKSNPSFRPTHSMSKSSLPDEVHNKESLPSTVFPFESLPYELKMKIFTYLSHIDKGIAMGTCREWKELLSTSSLWSTVMLSDLPMTCIPSANHQKSVNCYQCYKDRVHMFARYISLTHTAVKYLDFKFDIGEPEDEYLEMIQMLLSEGNLQSLMYLHFNWKETPTRPFWLGDSDWSNCNNLVFRQRHRGRLFVYFFDDLTKVANKITTLLIPFLWSERSVSCLTRLKNLHSLVIEKYFVFQALEQKLLDALMDGLPNLKRLMLEVWSPSGPGLIPYSIKSQSLEFLDISQSRGFYLHSIDLPRLTRFRVARRPWNGPLVCADKLSLSCLYKILVDGAPCLQKFNDHYLQEGWKESTYPTLEEVLKVVCSCRKHKIGWAM